MPVTSLTEATWYVTNFLADRIRSRTVLRLSQKNRMKKTPHTTAKTPVAPAEPSPNLLGFNLEVA